MTSCGDNLGTRPLTLYSLIRKKRIAVHSDGLFTHACASSEGATPFPDGQSVLRAWFPAQEGQSLQVCGDHGSVVPSLHR